MGRQHPQQRVFAFDHLKAGLLLTEEVLVGSAHQLDGDVGASIATVRVDDLVGRLNPR